MPASTLAHTEARRHKEVEQRLRLPIRGVVKQVLPDFEAIEVDMGLETGFTRLGVRHPYVGPNSWMRVMPEASTEVLTLQRGDTPLNTIVGYFSSDPDSNVASFEADQQLYRPLNPGEMEMMSNGRAYLFLGKGGDVETRGGTIRQELSQSRLELRSIAPTYARKLHTSPPYTVANEERFGVVKRPDTIFKNSMQQYIKLPTTEFAVEYSRWLNNRLGVPIIEHQEGDIVDGLGLFTKQSSTNFDLRYHKKIYHKAAGYLLHQVDQNLNILLSNTSTSIETKVDLGAKNVLRLTAQDIKTKFVKGGSYIYGTSLTTTAPTTKFNASTLFTVESAKVHLKAPITHFGKAPLLPIALAAPTTTAFNTAFGAMQGLTSALTATFPAPNPIGVAAAALATALAGALSTANQIPSKQVFASG